MAYGGITRVDDCTGRALLLSNIKLRNSCVSEIAWEILTSSNIVCCSLVRDTRGGNLPRVAFVLLLYRSRLNFTKEFDVELFNLERLSITNLSGLDLFKEAHCSLSKRLNGAFYSTFGPFQVDFS